jgi:hypothetical protein
VWGEFDIFEEMEKKVNVYDGRTTIQMEDKQEISMRERQADRQTADE